MHVSIGSGLDSRWLRHTYEERKLSNDGSYVGNLQSMTTFQRSFDSNLGVMVEKQQCNNLKNFNIMDSRRAEPLAKPCRHRKCNKRLGEQGPIL